MRDKHLKWQLRQRPRRHNNEVLAFDEVFSLTKKRFVKGIGARQIEGERRIAFRRSTGHELQKLIASIRPAAIPSLSIEPAAERCNFTSKRRCAKFASYPMNFRLCDNPDKGFFRCWLALLRIKEQHKRLVIVELSLNLLYARWSRAGECFIIRKPLLQCPVNLADAGIYGGKPNLILPFGLGVAFVRRLAEPSVLQPIALQPFHYQILALAHQDRQRWIAFAAARRHLCQRSRCLGADRPLRS